VTLEPTVLEGQHVRLGPGRGGRFATGGQKILNEGGNRL
jgi:hypothetical protein